MAWIENVLHIVLFKVKKNVSDYVEAFHLNILFIYLLLLLEVWLYTQTYNDTEIHTAVS